MTTRSFVITTVALLVLSGVAWTRLHHYNQHLREKIADQARPAGEAPGLREENERLRRLIRQTQAGGGAAEQAMATELENARTELRELKLQRDRLAMEKASRSKQELAALDANRNPETGPVRIEHFQNLGRATPSAAFQTLIWAAVTGADDTLAKSISLEAGSRAQLLALLAGLSPETRAKYRNPENLVSVFIAADIFKGAAAEIREQTNESPDHVTLSIRAGDKPHDARLPMHRSADGWRLAVTETQVENLIARLREKPSGL